MKLTLALFILTVFSSFAADLYSQNTKLSLDYKDEKIVDILRKIEDQSQYRFFYNEEVDVNSFTSIGVTNASIKEVLDIMFDKNAVGYEIIGRQIILRANLDRSLGQQSLTITGKVTDSSGAPLPGVTVVIKNTTQGTITDGDGKYSISNVPGDGTLVFSFVGMKTQEVAVMGKTFINLAMEEDAIGIEEVVAVGYGTMRKKDLTTSVSTVKMDDTEKKSMSNFVQAIQGKVAGVRVIQASGKPTGNFSIQIRGATSISSSNNPLYVIDGIPTDGTGNINPSDIESMQILKDASSSAIYGARAANGVVLITTKRGRAGKPQVNVRATYGISNVTKKLDVLNSKQLATLINDERANAGLPIIMNPDTIQIDNNWQDIIYSNAMSSDIQVSYSGGNEDTKFYISGNVFQNDGVIKPSTFERYAFKMNLDHQMYEWLSFGSSINMSRSKSIDIPDNAPVNAGGTVLGALSTPPFVEQYTSEGYFGYNPFQGNDNPLSSMYGSDSYSRSNKLLGNVFAKIQILPALSFKSSFGVEAFFDTYDSFTYVEKSAYARSIGGAGSANSNQGTIWLNENILDFSKTFDKHVISAIAGMTTQKSQLENSWLGVRGFPNSLVKTLNAASTATSFGTNATEWSLLSYLARISYAYDDRYLMSANFRRDGSSKFGVNNKYGNFPSISVGWRISQEEFMENVEVINDLKLRVSHGLTGNQSGINDYAHLSRVALGANYPFSGNVISGIFASSLGNESLKWESTRQTDIGLDLSLFNSALVLVADVYLKKTTDALLYVNLPLSTGFWDGIQNFAEIENKGLEIELTSRNLNGEIKWTTEANISINRNKILKIAGGEEAVIFSGTTVRERGNVTVIREGQPMSQFYGYRVAGVNAQTGDIDYISADGTLVDGSMVNADEDRVVIGNPNPKFIYGLTNTISYEGLTLSILLQGISGNDIFNASRVELEAMEGYKNAGVSTLNRWMNPGDITEMPRALFGSSINSLVSDRFVEKGSFLRVKNITLAYDFTQPWLKKAQMKNLNVFVTAQNLLTFTKYSGYDPEVSTSTSPTALGIDYGTFPNVRTFTFGANITF